MGQAGGFVPSFLLRRGVCVMTKLINCPTCAAIKAFNQSLLKLKGKVQNFDPQYCNQCGGSGKVREVPKRLRKRLKDLSGPEWQERQEEDEWNHYITFERKD